MDYAQWLTREIAEQLAVPLEQVNTTLSFVDMGLDSVDAIQIAGRITERFGLALEPTVLYDYPNVRRLAEFLTGLPHDLPH